MPPEDRFNRIESEDKLLPEKVRAAVSKLDRFGHLEIGELKTEKSSPVVLASNRILCAHCAQPNESARDICWACFKPLREETSRKPETDQTIQLILDGQTYRSDDPNVPHDILMLMERIREEGYSEELLREWREWRSTRNTVRTVGRPFDPPAAHDATAFQGQRISVIRIDGKVYQSDAPDLAPEIRELFNHIEKNGVTPELLNHLRQHGDKVKYRPNTTSHPSDGDIDFWKSVGNRTLDTLTTPLPVGGYGQRRFIPQTFRQHLITLAISIGIPAILIIWIWWRYFNTLKRLVGN